MANGTLCTKIVTCVQTELFVLLSVVSLSASKKAGLYLNAPACIEHYMKSINYQNRSFFTTWWEEGGQNSEINILFWKQDKCIVKCSFNIVVSLRLGRIIRHPDTEMTEASFLSSLGIVFPTCSLRKVWECNIHGLLRGMSSKRRIVFLHR